MLRGRVVIVTGASRGLGLAMSRRLAEWGARIVGAARNAEVLQAAMAEIAAAEGEVLAVPADVRDERQVQRLVEQTLARFGRIDVLVNNAGLMAGDVAFADTTPALWREVLDTNLYGAFLCCRAVLPVMLEQGAGVIVNITSGAAVRTGFLNVPYGVSKAGLDRLTSGLAAEYGERGIACVSLSPPVSATATVRRMYADRDVDAWARPPEWTAGALCDLLGDDDVAAYNGRVLSVRAYLERRASSPAADRNHGEH